MRHRRLILQRLAALVVLVALGVAAGIAAAGVVGSSASSPARPVAAREAPQTASAPVRRPDTPARPRHRPSPGIARAIAWARAQDGKHEIGTTNCSPAIARWERHMGLSVPSAPPCRPWCGAFVHEAFRQGGIDLSSRLIDPNQSYTDAVQGRNGLRRIHKRDVRPGDLVFFAIVPGLQASHEALVIGYPRRGRVRTAEGNVGHHAVVTRRGLRYVALAARVTRR